QRARRRQDDQGQQRTRHRSQSVRGEKNNVTATRLLTMSNQQDSVQTIAGVVNNDGQGYQESGAPADQRSGPNRCSIQSAVYNQAEGAKAAEMMMYLVVAVLFSTRMQHKETLGQIEEKEADDHDAKHHAGAPPLLARHRQ